jgi:ankyrin repeat protein
MDFFCYGKPITKISNEGIVMFGKRAAFLSVESKIFNLPKSERSQAYSKLASLINHYLAKYQQKNKNLKAKKTSDGYSLVHFVALIGDVALFKSMFSLENLNTASDNGYGHTPAFFAVKYGHVSLLEYLFTEGVSPNQVDISRNSLAILAASHNQVSILNLLLKWGADFHQPNDRGCYPIHIAAYSKSVDALQFLKERGHSINLPLDDDFGNRLTHEAIRYDDQELLKLLFNQNANFCLPNKLGDYPIHQAVQLNNQSGIDSLLAMGIPLNQTNKEGQLAIELAIIQSNIEIVKKLLFKPNQLEHQVPFHRSNNEGQPLLHQMIKKLTDDHLFELMPLLLERDIFIWWFNANNESPVMLAALYGKIKTLTFLLENEEKIKRMFLDRMRPFESMVEQRSNIGCAPLHYAIMRLSVVNPEHEKILIEQKSILLANGKRIWIPAFFMSCTMPSTIPVVSAAHLIGVSLMMMSPGHFDAILSYGFPPQVDVNRQEEDIRAIFNLLIKHGASYSQPTSCGVSAKQFLLFAIPKIHVYRELWQEIIGSFMSNSGLKNEHNNPRQLDCEDDDELVTLELIINKLFGRDEINFYKDLLLEFLAHVENNQIKFKLVQFACQKILNCISTLQGRFDIQIFSLIEKLIGEMGLDLQELVTYENIFKIAILKLQLAMKSDPQHNSYMPYIQQPITSDLGLTSFGSFYPIEYLDDFLVFVCTLLPKYYVRCLQDLNDYLIAQRESDRSFICWLIERHGLGIKYHFSDETFQKASLGNYFKYYCKFRPFLAIGSTVSSTKSAFYKEWYKPYAINIQDLVAEDYTQYDIVSYLHILSTCLVNLSGTELDEEYIKQVKHIFFSFLNFAQTRLNKMNPMESLNDENQAFVKSAKDDCITEHASSSDNLYLQQNFEKLVISAAKKLLQDMRDIRKYFSSDEQILLHKIVHKRFPTLKDLAINAACYSDNCYMPGVIDRKIAKTCLKIFRTTQNVNKRSHFIKYLGLFTHNNGRKLITIEESEDNNLLKTAM